MTAYAASVGRPDGSDRRVEPVPAEWARALDEVRAARLRPELVLEEVPAPQRLAPHAVALSADVLPAGSRPGPDADLVEEIGTGRLVVLHDPAMPEAWHGAFRCVCYARAALDPEMAGDPLLPAVGWAWLVEALDLHGAAVTALSGTVTRVASESFGGIADEPGRAEVEVRASWTPLLPGGLTPHVEAWGDLLCAAAGLAPLPVGVAPLPARPWR